MTSQKDMSGDISGYGLHLADVATDNYERDFNLSLVSNERRIVIYKTDITVELVPLTPVVGAHAGPGTLGIGYIVI